MLAAAVIAALVIAIGLTGVTLVVNRVALTRPPGVLARLAIVLTRNEVETGTGAVLEELAPLYLVDGDRARALDALAAACRALGWHDVRSDVVAGTVSAEVRTRWLRFTDDVRITLLAAPGGALEARVRSASRVGRGDLGANARHVMDLRDELARAGVLAQVPR